MFAIVKIAGQQFRVEKDQELYVPHVDGKAGDKVEFSELLLLDNKGKVLAQPRGYTPDVKQYLSYLDEGLCRYQKRKSENKSLAVK